MRAPPLWAPGAAGSQGRLQGSPRFGIEISPLCRASPLYAASAVLMPAALVALKRRGPSLPVIWAHFVVFQAARALLLNWRVWRKGGFDAQ